MAEFVQYRTEQTISELEQMQRIELFTKEEIRLIAGKRQRYEYKMQRISKTKDTYLRYIQYELDLIRLIKLRREKTKIFFKVSEIEIVIVNRISNLFFKAVAKYKTDVKLWMTHIRFCMEWNRKAAISAILIRMLAVHNDKVKVWKFAVNWEFEQNESMETARKLMLRGLRFHPKSKSLYKAYLAMELKYAEDKRRILEEKDNLEKDLTVAEIELMEKMMQTSDNTTRECIRIKLEGKRETMTKNRKPKLKTKLAEIIFDSALTIFRDLQTFIEMFLVVREFESAKGFQEKILRQLHEKFPSNEVLYDLQVSLALDRNADAILCKAAYARALQELPTEKMWSLYLDALCSDKTGLKKDFLRNELEACHNLGLLNEKFYPKLITLLHSVKDKQALPTLLEGLKLSPKSGDLHLLHVQIHLSSGKEDLVLSALERAEADLGKDCSDMLHLYKTIIQHYENVNFGLADKLFKRSLFAGPNVSTGLKPCYLQWVYDKKGIDAAHAEYKTLQLVPPLCLKLHYKMIALEMSQTEVNVKNVRLCYDTASHQFGEKDPDLWMKFITFELRTGDPKLAPLLYTRAKARLATDLLDGFVTQYTLDRSNGKV